MTTENQIEQALEKIKKLTALLASELEKFRKGNKAAGTRARKILQDLKKSSQEVRLLIQVRKDELSS